jgi:molybdopterin synthase catalytic subunit
MKAFELSSSTIDPQALRASFADPACGAYASFEGWVRDHNDGRRVLQLEYEAYAALAVTEGTRIVEEACARFALARVACVHRVGVLAIGDMAVWVGVGAAHRAAAFAACRYVIDEVKARVPIWKKEHYTDGTSGWVACEACATHAHAQAQDTSSAHPHFHQAKSGAR